MPPYASRGRGSWSPTGADPASERRAFEVNLFAPQAPSRAVRAVVEGRGTAVPMGERMSLAVNALVPELVSRKVARPWRGIGVEGTHPGRR